MRISDIDSSLNRMAIEELKYLRKYIGKYREKDIDRKQALESIRKAVMINKSNEYLHIDVELFSYAYPESINYFKDYFDYYSRNCKTQMLKKTAKLERKIGLLMFVPLFKLDPDYFNEYAEKLGSNTSEMLEIINFYDKNLANEKVDEKTKLAEKRKKFNSIKRNVLKFDLAKVQICDKCGITEDEFNECISLFDKKGEVSYKLNENEKEYLYLKELSSAFIDFLVEGKEVDGHNMDFTILDYYSLTDVSPSRFKLIFRENFSEDDFIERDRLMSTFFSRYYDLGCTLRKEYFVNTKIRYPDKDDFSIVSEEVADYIYNIFDEGDVPKKRTLLEVAMRRYYHNQPILPFIDFKNEKKDKVFVKKQ